MGRNQHVCKHSNGGWQVKGAGNSRATACTKTQKASTDIARSIAINQRSEVVIHGANGRIREKNSYGKDSFPPRG